MTQMKLKIIFTRFMAYVFAFGGTFALIYGIMKMNLYYTAWGLVLCAIGLTFFVLGELVNMSNELHSEKSS